MKVVGLGTTEEFLRSHPDARSPFAAWLSEARTAQWHTPSDIKARYRSASFMAENRVVFNIGGNKYRLDIKVAYAPQVARIVRIGTHADYDHWVF